MNGYSPFREAEKNYQKIRLLKEGISDIFTGNDRGSSIIQKGGNV
jgi:hypothetical protein